MSALGQKTKNGATDMVREVLSPENAVLAAGFNVGVDSGLDAKHPYYASMACAARWVRWRGGR